MAPTHWHTLEQEATRIRLGIIEAVASAKCGHPGGSLSIADILSVLYFDEMHIDPQNPGMENRDRLVLSKGHAAPALYAALARRGYFPESDLTGLRRIDSHLQGHPDKNKTPGVDMSSGSLGQGLSAACGMALAARYDRANWRVYCILGDGECQEGQVWEAANTAAHYKLDNLCAFFDLNGLQIDGAVRDVMNVYPLDAKLAAFGWHVLNVDGHDLHALVGALKEAKNTKRRPSAILCHTVKGKGVSFMENAAGWHGAAPDEAQAQQAKEELRRLLLEPSPALAPTTKEVP